MEDFYKPNHLLLEELDYELNIRNVFTQRNQAEKRKILTRLLEKERANPGYLINLERYTYNFEAESRAINTTLNSIKTLIADFEGTASDSTFLRLKSRLTHITGRVKRMLLPEEEADAAALFKNEAHASCLEYEAELHERVRKDDPNTSFNATINPMPTINVPPPVVTFTSRSVPISEWGVKFNGDSRNVYSFLERVTELAKARKVDDQDLFNSAVELFVGEAFIWYRSIKFNVADWGSLVALLKHDFLPPNVEDDIWDEVKSRKQKRNEKITIFIAQMENLFSRLDRPPQECTKVKYMRQNLLPEYINQLALLDINTVSQLSELCKKIENASYLKFKSNSSPPVHYLSESAEVFPSTSKSKDNLNRTKRTNFRKNNDVTSASKVPGPLASTSKDNEVSVDINSAGPTSSGKQTICWNCGKANHTFSVCKFKRKKFCFRCGMPNVTVFTCDKCSKNQ